MASTIVRGPEKAEILFLFFSMYKRKQENTLSTKEAIRKKRKEERKHAFDQESDKKNDDGQEKKEKKTRSRPRRRPKKEKLSFFSYFLVFFYIYCHLLPAVCFSKDAGAFLTFFRDATNRCHKSLGTVCQIEDSDRK